MKYFLVYGEKKFELGIDLNSGISNELLNDVPLQGKGNNLGGEVYFNIPNDILFNRSEREVFEPGDVVYWRSQEIDKFAIAILYGNTKYGDGTKPRTSSPCIKFAKIVSNFSDLKDFVTGRDIKIILN